MTLDYLHRFPKPADVPLGKVVCHNQVVVGITPNRRPGVQGFRAWWVDQDADNLVVCQCGWAPKLGTHFRLSPPVS
jgi:hypothetical protein